MAVCSWCQQEMMAPGTISCEGNEAVDFPDGVALPAVPYYSYDGKSKCHDCGVHSGGNHHPGCDAEECPRCRGQLISCGCLDPRDDSELDGPEDEEDEEDDKNPLVNL